MRATTLGRPMRKPQQRSHAVQTLPAPEGAVAGGPDGRIAAARIAPPAESLEQALTLLRTSKRPVIIVGHGARTHMPAVSASIASRWRMNSIGSTNYRRATG